MLPPFPNLLNRKSFNHSVVLMQVVSQRTKVIAPDKVIVWEVQFHSPNNKPCPMLFERLDGPFDLFRSSVITWG